MPDNKLATLKKILDEFIKEVDALKKEHKKEIDDILEEIKELKLQNIKRRIKAHNIQ